MRRQYRFSGKQMKIKSNKFGLRKKFFLLFVLFLVPFAAFGSEGIKNFHADIQVQTDGSVVVTEKITVHSDGLRIKRGISRHLPKKKGVKYSVLSVKRDGKKEPYSVSSYSKPFFTINTGNDTFLPYDGSYEYEITYIASNVILSFKDYDEIYWNVTGNEWDFPIKHASASVFLLVLYLAEFVYDELRVHVLFVHEPNPA